MLRNPGGNVRRRRFNLISSALVAFVVQVSLVAQTPTVAPYTVTQANPLIITKAAGADADTVAFLEEIADSQDGRTHATRAGFDFDVATDGGQGWTGLVWRSGVEPTYRVAIELPGGHLSAPAVYTDNPWDWTQVQVFDEDIAPGPGTIGWPPGGTVGAMNSPVGGIETLASV